MESLRVSSQIRFTAAAAPPMTSTEDESFRKAHAEPLKIPDWDLGELENLSLSVAFS
jgi:hypothetical protein